MENSRQMEKSVTIVDGELHSAESIIDELDQVIQSTGNLDLSKTINDISDSYQEIRALIHKKKTETQQR